jgi:hypothetical protein
VNRWLTLIWWRYILDDSFANKGYGTYLSRIWCRIRRHPSGPWFANAGGLEPDMRCKDCGEDLG